MRRLPALLAAFLAAALALPVGLAAQDEKKPRQKKDRTAPPKSAKAQSATPAENLKVARGFKVELLYSVPRDKQGSWVNLCVDPKGRLIASDQYGPLYRVTPPPVGGRPEETKVEKVPVEIGMAQGLLWAFDSLYVVVNGRNPKAKQDASGLYRVTDSDGDDQLDKVEKLREFQGGGGEHGPHAVLLHPDGKRLTVVCGNQTKLTKFDTTRVPPVWGEDHLLPRMPDGNGFMAGVLGPGGAIYNVTPDGKTWELFGVGFRNEYDAAYNRNGDLFTYDADMEWDMNTPWYRPTRVCFVTSGSEFGWRNGAGKYPPYYPDSLPAILDVGPGSPTGVCFGYGAKFPQKYQDAFFICDWSYGKLYAAHLTPKGASYTGVLEEFVTGTPLALTDVVVNPKDGALYFAVGGRQTQSGLYRVTYQWPDKQSENQATFNDAIAKDVAKRVNDPIDGPPAPAALRKTLEQFHGKKDPKAVEVAWAALNHPDRFVRFAARVALEHQSVALWREKALAEPNPLVAIHALLALCRVSAPDPFHRKPSDQPADPDLRAEILAALNRIDFAALGVEPRLDLLRVYHVACNRFGKPTYAERDTLVRKFEPLFPTRNRYVDGEILQLLVYLEAPSAAAKGVAAMLSAPTQEEQMEYARALRVLRAGWTPELRARYISWFGTATHFRGGNSLRGFLKIMRDDTAKTFTRAEKKQIQPLLDAVAKASPASPADAAPPRPFVKKWTMDELAPKLEAGLRGGRDFDRGRKLFAEARCFGCHRYGDDGSAYGPDLTGIAGRFSPRDLLESVIDPSKEVSDQYAAVEIEMADGRKVVGRIVNLHGNNLSVNTDMLDPNKLENVNRDNVESMKPSKTSMMPAGLIDVLREDEALDLMAYLLSRGDRNAPMFRR